jgi:peptidoglycan-associated lipoprotein
MVYLALAGWFLVWIGTDGCARRSGVVEQGVSVGPTAGSGSVDDSQVRPGGEQAAGSDGVRGDDIMVVGLSDVFFQFDSAIISPDVRPSLDRTAQWLRKSTDRRVVIEGHADERGTNEYNLALGERRARAVKRYLAASGIDERRIDIVTYGEEKPFCRDRGEQCWQENRRGHFVQAD